MPFAFAFADGGTTVAAEPWVVALTAVAVALGSVAQILLQILASWKAAREATASAQRQAALAALVKEDTRKTQEAALAAADEARATRGHAEEVKFALNRAEARSDQKLTRLAEVAQTTQAAAAAVHGLVNGARLAQQRVVAQALRRVAELTGTDADQAAARAAEAELRRQEDSQPESPRG